MATDALRQASARSDAEIALIANRMRHDIIEMLGAAGSGHPGGSLSATDIMATLFYSGLLGMDPADPNNPERDRFILSKGHACPIYYAALNEKGYFQPKVDMRTGTDNKHGIDAMAAFLAAYLSARGLRTHIVEQKDAGNILMADFPCAQDEIFIVNAVFAGSFLICSTRKPE